MSQVKSKFSFEGVKLIDVSKLEREGKRDLIFLKLHDTATLENTNSIIYFGSKSLQELQALILKTVNVELIMNDRVAIKEVY